MEIRTRFKLRFQIGQLVPNETETEVAASMHDALSTFTNTME